MWWLIVIGIVLFVIVSCIFAALKLAAMAEEQYPHLNDYKDEIRKQEQSKNDKG